MSTSEDRALIEEIENHAATINRYLDTLKVALKNAKRVHDRDLVHSLGNEIDYYVKQLAELQARRAAIARRMRG